MVRAFADRVLALASTARRPEGCPLLPDGWDLEQDAPVRWTYAGSLHPNGSWAISDLALQQDLLRALAGLSAMTGDARYADAAAACFARHADRLASPCGLLHWGGHEFVDLETETPQGPHMGGVHELKCDYPFYELFAAARPAAAARFVAALWHAHVSDWSRLDFGRHGAYSGAPAFPLAAGGWPAAEAWDHGFSGAPPFFEAEGLSFLNAGSDLIFAAATLARLGLPGGERALAWAARLDDQYRRARHPGTHLGVYQFSRPRRRRPPPEAGSPSATYSMYGDRAERQLGPELGPAALEGNVLTPGRAEVVYGHHAVIQLQLAEECAAEGAAGAQAAQAFRAAALEGLEACARHLLVSADGSLRPALADGTDLTGFALRRDGYYGRRGQVFRPAPAGGVVLWAFALAHRATGDAALWDALRALARRWGLGDLGRGPGRAARTTPERARADPAVLFALLELHAGCPHPPYLRLAEAVADRLVAERFTGDLFVPQASAATARFGCSEPLALLALEARAAGRDRLVPRPRPGRGFLDGWVDDEHRTTDHRWIWARRRA